MAKILNPARVLAIDGSSSSIKFTLYPVGEALEQRLYGKIDRIGLSGTNRIFHDPDGKPQVSRSVTADHQSTASFLMDWFDAQKAFASVKAVGHRVVHGMAHSKPEQVTTCSLFRSIQKGRPETKTMEGISEKGSDGRRA